jgi:hypothetical protein
MRTVLYANKDVSEFPSSNFVLLWTSERPVPKVSIDFGDGRKLERTITGNAVHYVLDSHGRPIDALPGLYAPRVFLDNLRRSVALSRDLDRAEPEARTAMLGMHHRAQREMLAERVTPPAPLLKPISAILPPDAFAATRVTTTKLGIELRVLKDLKPARPEPQAFDAENAAEPGDDYWGGLAAAQGFDARLDSRSLAVMARELPEFAQNPPGDEALRRVRAAIPAREAIALAGAKGESGEARLAASLQGREQDLAGMARRFVETLAADTARNEFRFHARIHRWFAEGDIPSLDALNERVYAEIFLTPRSDPWLGLGAEGRYTGTSDGGRK